MRKITIFFGYMQKRYYFCIVFRNNAGQKVK